MIYSLTAYIRFLLKSSNQHGVHSPFVYQYVTQCLYRDFGFQGIKTIRVILNSLEYFKSHNILISANYPDIRNRIAIHFPDVRTGTTPYDFIFLPALEINTIYELMSKPGRLHNDTLVLIDQPYKDKESTELWKTLKTDNRLTVTIDMFHCCAVFFRQEQAREHFRIRI